MGSQMKLAKDLDETHPICEDYMSIASLKEKIKDLPDTGKVYIQRVEDDLFETHGWGTKKVPCPEYNDENDEYIMAWCSLNYKDGNLYLTAHY